MLIGAGIGIPFQQNVLARLLGSAEFFAPLTHSAIPTRAASGTTGTFTRATTSTWQNNDGYLVTGVAGEIGFPGARRVRNYVSKSEAFELWATKAFNGTGTIPVVTAGFTDPLGGTAARRLQANRGAGNAGSDYSLIIDTTGTAFVGTAIYQLWVKSNTGVTQNFAYGSSSGGTVYQSGVATTTWTLFETSPVAVTTDAMVIGTRGGLGNSDNNLDILIYAAQRESVTAQTTQTAGEYVSVGVESAPYYHGSMVDGVKCFATDINGAAIPSTTLLGYQAEGARTNYQPNSNAFTTSWVSSGAGVSLAQNAVDDDGATTAWTATITGAGQYITYATTGIAADQICTLSINLWPVDAGTTRIAVYNTTGGAQFNADCDPSTGTITATSSSVGASVLSTSVTPIAGGGYRFSVTGNTAGGGVQTNNPVIYYGDGVDVKQSKVQFEIGSFASSYIATTTAAVTRNKDEESVSTSGNIAAAAGSIYLEYTPTHTPSGTIALWGTYVDASNYTAILHDATNLIFRKRIAGVNYDATIANAFTANTTYKVCGSWGASGVTVTLDGTEGTANANTTAAQIAATMQWGADGNSLQQPFAYLRNCRDWLRQLSASERVAVTA